MTEAEQGIIGKKVAELNINGVTTISSDEAQALVAPLLATPDAPAKIKHTDATVRVRGDGTPEFLIESTGVSAGPLHADTLTISATQQGDQLQAEVHTEGDRGHLVQIGARRRYGGVGIGREIAATVEKNGGPANSVTSVEVIPGTQPPQAQLRIRRP